MATNALSQIAVDFEEYARQTTILKRELDWQAYMVGAKREGRAEGLAEKAFIIAQNMVKLGLPIETVIAATQLDPEKVKELYQKRGNTTVSDTKIP